MKNIAIIITKLRGGGAERVASNLSIELEQNYNISLIVFDGQDRAYPYGGKLFDLQLPAQKTSLKRIKNMFYRIKAVKKIKEEESIDCTISLLDGPNIVNLLSKRRDKVIVSVRNLLSSENMSILRKMTIKYVGNHSDKLVALSKLVKKDLANNFGISDNKMVTIYNSCDNARLLELSQSELGNKFKLESGCRYVVTVGRLTKQKGQWHLIRAFRKVVDIIPNAKLLILGEGELFDKLKLLSDELQLSDNIIFVGFVKNPHSIIRKCDIFVFPSLFEGLGNALIEALAMGKAIVSTDCDAGPREILAPSSPIDKKTREIELADYGILVPVGDEEHFNSHEALSEEENLLADAICMLLKDENLKRSYEIKATSRSIDFSPKNITEKWYELIDSLIKN